jgi:nitroreductase
MTLLDLTPDEVLRTTRAVRKRLDFARPVEDDVIRECVSAAMQAPSGSNNMTMRFVVVKDEGKRKAIGEIYRQCFEIYKSMDGIYAGSLKKDTDAEQAQQHRVTESALYLADHMGDAPALVIACTAGRLDGAPAMMAVSSMGNVLPGMWSFMLAARARGLGTAWTTVGLMQEQAIADVVGIPFAEVQQSCLSPLAYTTGTDFKPAMRPEPDAIIHWDTW